MTAQSVTGQKETADEDDVYSMQMFTVPEKQRQTQNKAMKMCVPLTQAKDRLTNQLFAESVGTLVRTRPGLWSLMCSSVAAMSISFTPNDSKETESLTLFFSVIIYNIKMNKCETINKENVSIN